MDLRPILMRLKSELNGFKTIGGIADLAAMNQSAVQTPSCYVAPVSESAEDNGLLGAFEQRVDVVFSVVLVCTNRRDATGAAAMGDLEDLRTQIRNALLAWYPDPAIGEPIAFSGGRLLSFDDGLLSWAEEFRVKTYMRIP